MTYIWLRISHYRHTGLNVKMIRERLLPAPRARHIRCLGPCDWRPRRYAVARSAGPVTQRYSRSLENVFSGVAAYS